MTKLKWLIASILYLLLGTNIASANSASFHLGFNAGGISIGGDYEINLERNTGAGAYFHLIPKDDDDGPSPSNQQ